jgi:hypothetical protein
MGQCLKIKLGMALALVYPDPEKGGRGQKSSVTEGLTAERLSVARTVLRYSVDCRRPVEAVSLCSGAAGAGRPGGCKRPGRP